jgi:dihydroorotate dehydrogenase
VLCYNVGVQNFLYNHQLTYRENYARRLDDIKSSWLSSPDFAARDEASNLHIPFGIPAGPLLNSAYCQAAFEAGYDICTYKTVRAGFHGVNDFPNILFVHPQGDELHFDEARAGVLSDDCAGSPVNICNSFGVPSFEPDIWQPDLKIALESAAPGQKLVASFQGLDGSTQSFVDAAKLIVETGVRELEMNTSCPNEGADSLLCHNPEAVGQIAQAVKNAIGDIPLHIKIGYLDDELLRRLVAETVEKGRAQGIAAINTIPAKLVNSSGQNALGDERETSGVCGSAIKWAGIEMTTRLKAFARRFADDFGAAFRIIGVGGVHTPGDYFDYLDAGADEVLAATGPMFNAGLANSIKREILGTSGGN